VACRLCRNPLRAAVGCEACGPLKSLLHWPEGALVASSDLAQDLAGVMRAQLTKLKRQLSETDEFNGRLVRELNQLANQLTKLLTELRHSEKLAADRVKQLTFDEQSDAIINEWLVYLPPEQLRGFLLRANSFDTVRNLKVLK